MQESNSSKVQIPTVPLPLTHRLDPGQPVSPITLLGVAAPVLAIINSSMFSCMCGYVNGTGLVGNGIAVAMAWYCLIRHGIKHCSIRLIFDVLTAITTVILVRNLFDILWCGHDALFDAPSDRVRMLWSRALGWSAAPTLCVSVFLMFFSVRHRPEQEIKNGTCEDVVESAQS